MSTTLPLFWHLSSNDSNERIDASVKLIHSLEQFQENFVPTDGSSRGNSINDGLDENNAQDVAYAIRRLIRGLASPRDSSRLGFAVALSELLSRLDTLTTSQVLAMVISSSQTQTSMSGQEERDMLFARLFGLMTMITSGLFCRPPASQRPEETPDPETEFTQIITELLSLGEKKPWARESCWWSICLALEKLHQSEVSWKSDAISNSLKTLFVEYKSWTPEKIALVLRTQPLYPNQEWSTLLSGTFKSGDLLSAKNIGTLCSILKEEGVDSLEENIPKVAGSTWKPQLHFVWDTILHRYFSSHSIMGTKDANVVAFSEFFRVVVDDALFANNSSATRKYRGFQVFQRCLSLVPVENLPLIFTKNMMRCWVNNLSQNDRHLHSMAVQLGKDLQNLVTKNPNSALPVIMTLLGTNGSQRFDKLTKTKTVESILTSMRATDIQDFLQYLLVQFRESSNPKMLDVVDRRNWVLEQIGIIVRNGAIPKDEETVKSIVEFLTLHSFFIVKKKATKGPVKTGDPIEPPLSEDFRESCRKRFLSSLSDLMTHHSKPIEGANSKRQSEESSANYRWMLKAVEIIFQLQANTKCFTSLVDADDDARSLYQGTESLLRTLTEQHADFARGAEIMLSGSLLYFMVNDSHSEMLEDCLDAISSLLSATETPNSNEDAEPSGSDGLGVPPPPIDLLVDLLIGYMEADSAFLRTVASQAFGLLSGLVQESTVDLILAQLEKHKHEDSDPESELDAADASPSESSSHLDSSSSHSDHTSSSDSETEEVDLELRQKVEDALRMNGVERAVKNDSHDAMSSSEEELLDDDQMLQFDEKLAEVFRLRRAERKSTQHTGAQREATLFKIRVLDLIDVFIRRQPNSPYLPYFLVPLIEASISSGKDERQFADKLNSLIRSRLVKTRDESSSMDVDRMQAALERLHQLARKVHSRDHLATIAACSIYLSRLLVRSGKLDVVTDAYVESLEDFIKRKTTQLNPAFFIDFCRKLPEAAWIARTHFLQAVPTAINGYRQCNMYHCISVLITSVTMKECLQDLTDYVSLFCNALCKTVSKACDTQESKTPNAAQLKEICKAALVVARVTRKTLVQPLPLNPWNIELLRETGQLLYSSDRFKQSGAAVQWKTLLAAVDAGNQSRAEATLKKNQSHMEEKTSSDQRNPNSVLEKETTPTKRKDRIGEDGLGSSGAEDFNSIRKPKRKKVRYKKTLNVPS